MQGGGRDAAPSYSAQAGPGAPTGPALGPAQADPVCRPTNVSWSPLGGVLVPSVPAPVSQTRLCRRKSVCTATVLSDHQGGSSCTLLAAVSGAKRVQCSHVDAVDEEGLLGAAEAGRGVILFTQTFCKRALTAGCVRRRALARSTASMAAARAAAAPTSASASAPPRSAAATPRRRRRQRTWPAGRLPAAALTAGSRPWAGPAARGARAR